MMENNRVVINSIVRFILYSSFLTMAVYITVALTGCTDTHKSPEPKFCAGQELKVTEGFYSSAKYFIPANYRISICKIDSSNKITIVYTGALYLGGVAGWLDNVSICEENLAKGEK